MRRLLLVLALVASTAASTAAQAQRKNDLEVVDHAGWTPLMRAAESGELPKITALLARGANLEASHPKVNDGATPLVLALYNRKYDAAKLFLDRGASVAGKLGITALELASRSGYDDLVDRLIAAKVSPKGTEALHLAAMFGRVSTIKKLVKAGARVRFPDKKDRDHTPFIVACKERQVEAARTLLALGANVNDVDADGTPALHWAVHAERPEEIHTYEGVGSLHETTFEAHADASMVKLLVGKGAKLEAVDADGNTALHKAAMLDAASAAKVLLAAGAKRTKKNGEGKTPYELAKKHNNSVEPILRAGR